VYAYLNQNIVFALEVFNKRKLFPFPLENVLRCSLADTSSRTEKWDINYCIIKCLFVMGKASNLKDACTGTFKDLGAFCSYFSDLLGFFLKVSGVKLTLFPTITVNIEM